MSKRNVDSQISIDDQSILRSSNQSCSFIYQLPDVVLKRKRERKMPYAETFQGIVLFADVSGFTEMCQKYSSDVQRGVNQLANALNSYMAPIVEAVLREKGDVYKFAGDAVLGLWPFENDSIEHKREQAKRVISCALYMKNSFCDYMTSIGTVLNIKSAIAMGSYSIVFLRGSTPSCSKLLEEYGMNIHSSSRSINVYSQLTKKSNSRKTQSTSQTNKTELTREMIERCRANLANYYVCYGSAVVNVRNAEHECQSQDIIIDMATWLLLQSDAEYLYEKFTVEHDDDDIEVSLRTSSHQMEFVGQIPSNSILTSISKHLTPPNQHREVLLPRKIISHYIRLHSRRNDISTDAELFDSHSMMSADSIEPNENNQVLKKPNTFNQYSPIKTSLNQWNTPKTPLLEPVETIDGKDFLSIANRKQEQLNRRIDLTEEQSLKLRPSVFEEYDTLDLSTFIIKPVRNQESLDQLSELRLINICFINIHLTDYKIKQLPFKLQTIIDCCAEQISITNGLLTKVVMFDKGLSLLCAFGLPGYKHTDDAERALKFAFLITQRLEKLNFVARVSTGVSTGQTFCGVLGHPLRCEYTVIGRKVNMAARLMVSYPGIVSCDDETYHKAHLDERYFELLPTVPLKGLIVSTSMRRYKGQDDDQNNMSVYIFPMINRETEWNILSEYIEQVIQHNCVTIHCLFLTGSTGVGRSRLLAHLDEELMYNTQNIRRISYHASFEHVQLFGYALKQLFKKLLYTELQESSAILRVLKSLLPNHEKYLYLLRPYFDKLNVDVEKISEISKRKILEEILQELVLNATNPDYEIFNYQPQSTIFIIDDAQYIDKESWQYLHLLGSAPTSLLVMAMRDPTLNDDELQKRMIALRDSSTTKHMELMGLDNHYLPTLACQAMFVQRIPKDLEILITRKSDKGHPQNVIQLLSDLLANQIIRIETINTNDKDENDIEGIQEYLWKRVVQHDPTTGNVKILFEYVEPQICRICDLDRNKFWSFTSVIENINAHVKIDKLRDFEKRIAKISSLFTKNISKRIIVYAMTNYDIHTNESAIVQQLNNNKHTLGSSPDLLKVIIKKRDLRQGEIQFCDKVLISAASPLCEFYRLNSPVFRLKINSAFSQLYRAQIFECAWLDFEARKNPTIARLIHEKNLTPLCCCPENATKQIENCRMYRFKDPTLKEATLATIIDQFQHDYSSKMALFIESKSHLCKSCNGDSDSLIFLTPVQSMKLGMSILDTFHERKFKQLNQRLQSMILNHLFAEEDKPADETENLLQYFYQNFRQREVNEEQTYFRQLRQNIQQVDVLTTNHKLSTLFNPMAIGERKATIEGETYVKMPLRLQENSLTQSEEIEPTRSSIETLQDVSIQRVFSKDLRRYSAKNNHAYQVDSHLNSSMKTCNEFLKRYLIAQNKYRLIIIRRLFKFRRKKFFHRSNNFNNNNHHTIIKETPKRSIEQILHRQWIQAFEQKKSHKNRSADSMNALDPSRTRIIRPLKYDPNNISKRSSSYRGKIEIPLMNNAINDCTEMIDDQEQISNKQSKSSASPPDKSFRHSPNGKNKRLFTKDIMSEAEHLVKHLHLSREKEHDSTPPLLNRSVTSEETDAKEKFFLSGELFSINERLYINFTETCPLFLLKEGIDHRFEFLDFAPDLYIRQRFHPNDSISTNPEINTQNLTEIEYNQRNCRCNYLLVEIYRLLIKFWNQSSNMEKVLYYSLELARVELTRTNYYESKIILENLLQLLEKEGDYLNLPAFFEPQIYDLLSGSLIFLFKFFDKTTTKSRLESVYRMRQNDEAFLYVVYGLKILNVQLIDFRSRDSFKLKTQCKQLRHTLIRTLIRQIKSRKLSEDELIQKYFTGKLLFRAGLCARRHGQLLFAYFCVLNATISLIQCHSLLTSYEHCQSLSLLAELSHDLKRMEDCDLFVQAMIKYIEPIDVGYETIAIKANWLSMTWNLYRAKIDRALNDSYKIKDLLNKIGAYENLMSVVTYSLQAALIGRREEVIRDLMDIIDNESNRPLEYENRLWSFVLILEAFVELNIEYDENLLNEIVHAIDYVLEHLEKKTSTPGEIQKFLTIVFYAQANLVECYTKLMKLDQANQHYMRAIKFGMSLKEWTFRVYNGMLKLALYEIYECTKWLLETRLTILPNDIHQRLIISHMYDISKYFQLLRPRYLMCLALKYLITGHQRLAKRQFANGIRLANDLELDSERKHIEMTRKQIFKVITKRKLQPIIKTKQKRTKN